MEGGIKIKQERDVQSSEWFYSVFRALLAVCDRFIKTNLKIENEFTLNLMFYIVYINTKAWKIHSTAVIKTCHLVNKM